MSDAIVAEGLVKRFGDAPALDGLDLRVAEGTVLGLLGPNGSGKTTTVKILTTLWRPDAGRATVAGVDVVADPSKVRRRIGLAGQFSAVDYTLTGRENLVLFGRLYRLGHRQAQKRADRLLERFNLAEVGRKAVKTYSGGMIRKLDLAVSLVASPRVLFMDEPTTGLDPAGRLELYDLLEEQVRGGMTLLLTSQYLEEVDRLATQIAVLARGKVIALGTADELKSQVGGDRVDVRLADPTQVAAAVAALRVLASGEPIVDVTGTVVGVPTESSTIAEVVRVLDRVGIGMQDITIHRPTLDDVFLKLTGASTYGIAAWAGPGEPAPAVEVLVAESVVDVPVVDVPVVDVPAADAEPLVEPAPVAVVPVPVEVSAEPAASGRLESSPPAARGGHAGPSAPVWSPAVGGGGSSRRHRAPGPPVEAVPDMPPTAVPVLELPADLSVDPVAEPAASNGAHAAPPADPSWSPALGGQRLPGRPRAGEPAANGAGDGEAVVHEPGAHRSDEHAHDWAPSVGNGSHRAQGVGARRGPREERDVPESWFRPGAEHGPTGGELASRPGTGGELASRPGTAGDRPYDPDATDPLGFVLTPAEPAPQARTASPAPGTGRRRRTAPDPERGTGR